jgi:hypothetical protein
MHNILTGVTLRRCHSATLVIHRFVRFAWWPFGSHPVFQVPNTAFQRRQLLAKLVNLVAHRCLSFPNSLRISRPAEGLWPRAMLAWLREWWTVPSTPNANGLHIIAGTSGGVTLPAHKRHARAGQDLSTRFNMVSKASPQLIRAGRAYRLRSRFNLWLGFVDGFVRVNFPAWFISMFHLSAPFSGLLSTLSAKRRNCASKTFRGIAGIDALSWSLGRLSNSSSSDRVGVGSPGCELEIWLARFWESSSLGMIERWSSGMISRRRSTLHHFLLNHPAPRPSGPPRSYRR